MMCDLLQVSRAGYYAWKNRPVSPRALRREALSAEICRAHADSRGLYGSPRIHQEVIAGGTPACVNTVAKVMREQGLCSKIHRKFVVRTTQSAHSMPVARNVLDRQFNQPLPDRAWCADITYIHTGEGVLYLAAVLDLCSRKIVGWSMADHMRSKLCVDALQMALMGRRAEPGLIVHSDRGVQYASEEYQRVLAGHQAICSMSAVGDCYDNAVAESFWGTLKTEEVYQRKYATRAEARSAIFEYIEVFYNRKRRHSSLGYVSPEAFEAGLN
jgi:transposase InsO family protein